METEDKLAKTLQTLKSVHPEEGFIKRSRDLILMAKQSKFGIADLKLSIIESFKWGMALSLASILLFVVAGGLASLQNISPALLSNLNDVKLRTEASNLDFQIRLKEISYSLESDQAISAKIDELLDELTL